MHIPIPFGLEAFGSCLQAFWHWIALAAETEVLTRRGSNRGSNENAKSDHLIGAYRSEPRLEPRDSFSRGSNESDVESDVDVIDRSDF